MKVTDQDRNMPSTKGWQHGAARKLSRCTNQSQTISDADAAIGQTVEQGADEALEKPMRVSRAGGEIGLPVIVERMESRPVDQLMAYASNARTHSESQIEQIAASIREFGFCNPILVGSDNRIIAGHARLRAAQQLGMREVPVIVLAHLSEAQRRALAIADNQLPLNAGWDEEILRAELAALAEDDFSLELIGFDEKELERLLAEQAPADGLASTDVVPAAPRIPVTVPGDLWVLGEHRLLCGDATRRGSIETVLEGRAADMVFTDPPCDKASTSRQVDLLHTGLGRGVYEFLRAACGNLLAFCRGALYLSTSSAELNTLFQAFTDMGGYCSTFLIWVDGRTALGQLDYQRQYTPILYGWNVSGERYWHGRHDQGDVWFIPRAVADREYPAVQPVELVERAVQNSSKAGDTVLDAFAGSGATLIACERQKRRACLIELDPRYVDVICQRWQQFSGKPAVLKQDERTFLEVAQQRRQKAA